MLLGSGLARSVLMYQHGQQLDDESLRNFMCEVSAIIESCPLSTQNLNNPKALEPLTPNHLLTIKSKVILSPPGQPQRGDLFSRKRWRRIQYLAYELWSKWREDYIQKLQVRQNWVSPTRNYIVWNLVILTNDNIPRNQ